MLLAHTDAVDQIEMWIGNHGQSVVVLHIGQPITVLVHMDEVADTANSCCKSIFLHLAIE